MPHSVFIKGMVCNRCKIAVAKLFKDLNIISLEVHLGEVILTHELSQDQLLQIQPKLKQLGFDLITDKRGKIAVNIKSLLIKLLEADVYDLKLKLSEYLSVKLNYEYHYLSNVFSELEGTTIEKYFILLKVEKIKEYIEYGELSLSEISYAMGYSSPAHLTNQFKQIMGYTPSHYKSIARDKKRKPLDEL